MPNVLPLLPASQIVSAPESPHRGFFYAVMGAALIGLLFNILIAFPGTPTTDSKVQYAEAVGGVFFDWFPPVMARLMWVLHKVRPGFAPLFLVHVTAYWAAFGIIALRLGKNVSAFAVLLVALMPQFFLENAVISNDVGAAVALLLGFALVFFYRAQGFQVPKSVLAVSLIFLGYATLVRGNAVCASAPLVVYAVAPQNFSKPLRFIGLNVLLIAALVPASGLINHAVFKARAQHPLKALEIFDVAGIAAYSSDYGLFPRAEMSKDKMDVCYTPLFWSVLDTGDCGFAMDTEALQFTHVWARAMLKHPFFYAEHRLMHWNAELDFWAPRHNSYQQHVLQPRDDDPYAVPTASLIAHIRNQDREGPFASSALTLVLNVLLLMLCYRRRKILPSRLLMPVIALCVSALFYTLSYLVIGVASDASFEYWSKMAVYVAAALFVSQQDKDSLDELDIKLSLGVAVTTLLMIWTFWTLNGDALPAVSG